MTVKKHYILPVRDDQLTELDRRVVQVLATVAPDGRRVAYAELLHPPAKQSRPPPSPSPPPTPPPPQKSPFDQYVFRSAA